ncbi:hypothetical protein D8B26_002054 [Coccidioides posadasii str. Silveira]|uniref:Nuclear polyadenylated RNA-binding protein Nab2 n=3 Tax=Coccidioides posadasii TaxID=199306 RepID=E9CXC5_COCPS|nr:hypothetical protein CPC735_052660 [Coccidioides posadasii C735 delta SOWgp]EER23896.1 hypothetical protein CPC735_052660 [Coccidioides posadasii C735 delta SOWgp]EFW21951.1 nuclear polyadenylated RNA-binding protein Nab2 [Coccidioides posadasii str. Silveira]KMM65412.1 hypothetical protein CPAG_01763 [Coccidioides posadasii RMSCC 3488]QVM07353.1 hypothetical protein D8B26_002054 [Coccidioides posadasii str. Silveira]|eukprot:XP_003066041.1 hypothetical protein CPC735_052660 [Coccidioides posadasii C735 delta SOWgp]
MAISVELNTPLAQALNEVIQPKLVEVGWSTGGGDDSALAEYVILMLVNGKTQEQIASELANDLLGLGPDDTEAVDFSRWLFEQVELLNKRLNGELAEPEPENAAQAIPSFTEGSDDAAAPASAPLKFDAEMTDSPLQPREGGLPSGPRNMRNPKQNGRGRLLGQITRAMDRSSESVLHRVRNQSGAERINMHREPPRGPRAFQARGGRSGGGRQAGGMGMNMGMGAMGMGNNPMQNMPPGSNMMTPQQQMQMMALFEEQARMMAQFMPGFVPPAINPAFQTAQGIQNQGRSLFERAEHHKDRNPHFQRHHQNGRQHNQGTNMDVDGGPKESTDTQMEEAPQSESQDRGTEGVCRYNLRCTNKDCPYAHQSPAAPEGTTIDVSDVCPFGAACKNRKCVARHPSPAQKAMHQSEELCKYFPHCQNPHCQFKHPSMPLCRNGADCSVPGCKFTHQQIPCRYKPCLNPTCPFKHSEGQKGVFSDKVWTAERKDAPHVSERKFVADEAGEEELIKPPPSSSEAEIVT